MGQPFALTILMDLKIDFKMQGKSGILKSKFIHFLYLTEYSAFCLFLGISLLLP